MRQSWIGTDMQNSGDLIVSWSKSGKTSGTNPVQDFAGFALAEVAPFEIFHKSSQNFSPAGVTSPFVARAMPTDATSVVRVSAR
jgi:hypothetical protein